MDGKELSLTKAFSFNVCYPEMKSQWKGATPFSPWCTEELASGPVYTQLLTGPLNLDGYRCLQLVLPKTEITLLPRYLILSLFLPFLPQHCFSSTSSPTLGPTCHYQNVLSIYFSNGSQIISRFTPNSLPLLWVLILPVSIWVIAVASHYSFGQSPMPPCPHSILLPATSLFHPKYGFCASFFKIFQWPPPKHRKNQA